MRIALVGTFDIANYGDLLFPEIVKARLKGIADVVCFSPLGAPPVWRDTPPTVDVDLLDEHDVDAVVLGGGNLVHAKPWNHDWYDTGGIRGYVAYPRLWFGASAAAAAMGIPLCWNAPGAPAPLGVPDAALLRDAAAVVDYLSVRDRASARHLAAAGVTSHIEVVPDPGLEVARLWTEQEIDRAHGGMWAAAGRPVPDRRVAVHLNERYVDEPPGAVATRLDAIARRLEATVVLVALGPCHDDDVLAERVGAAMESEPLVVPTPSGIRTLAAAIARSHAYLGSSLHGAITALSFGVPARVIGSGAAVAKSTGLAEHFSLKRLLLVGWSDAEAAAESLLRSEPDLTVADAAAPVLDRHWARIADVVTGARARPPGRARPDLAHRRLEELAPSVLDSLGSTIGDLRRRLTVAEDPGAEDPGAEDPVAEDPVAEDPVASPATDVEDTPEAVIAAAPVVEPERQAAAAVPAAPRQEPAPATSLSIAVVCWDLGHNALGRAHLLADMLASRHHVEIVGSHFPEFGPDIWGPLCDSPIPLRRYPGARFPEYFQTMERMAADLTADVVYVVKPRMPGLGVGLLARCDAGRGLAVDCDDLELSFVGASHGIPLAELETLRSRPEFLRPQGKVWTGFAEWAVRLADAVTVSNVPLAARYGGAVIPHARDERVFDPELYDRDEARGRLDLDPGDRVVLFAGTPRRHKGLQQVAAALERIGDRRNRLCVLATRELDEVKPLLAGLEGWIHPLPPQPFSRLPQLLSAADAICVLQDPASEMARWQMPAKITDALAMGVPCLATPTAPLLPLIDEGGLVPVGDDDLAAQLEAVLGDPQLRADQFRRGREIFLRRFSYQAVRPRLEEVLRRAAGKGGAPSADLAASVAFQRSVFTPLVPAEAAPADMAPAAYDGERPAVRPSFEARTRPRPRRSDDGGIDLVMFWRQNDSGIYGRRQDMLVKYLAASPKVRRIVHFDDAISAPALIARWREGRDDQHSQASLIARRTLRRALGTRPHPKVSAHTFVHQGEERGPGAWARRFLPRRQEYEAWVSDVLAGNGIGDRPLVFWAFPRHFEFPGFVRRFRPDLVVADVVDDTRAWSTNGRTEPLTNNYAEILGMSDLVLANCEAVKQAMGQFASDIHVVPNACELPPASPPRLRRPRELRGLRGPIVGYVGNLSSRIDLELLERMAVSHPDWHLVLIGSAHLNRDVLDLGEFENVHLLGVRPYEQLQAYLQAFDIAIVPHLDDAMTRVMNPLKPFVYAAANLPVVSTAVGNIDEMRSLVRVADDHDAFIAEVERALREDRSPTMSDARRAVLERHSWPRRVDEVLELIDGCLVKVGVL